MNVLDENILADQRQQLQQWRIRVRQIGLGTGTRGMSDENIIPLLIRLPQPTFFTRDHDFYRPRLCHARYCLVVLDVSRTATAEYIRRVLRHPEFNTRAKRMGAVLRASPIGLTVWRLHADRELHVGWAN